MARRPRLRVAIIGAGKVGSVLGRLLVDHGHVITAVVSRTPRSARAGGKFLKCRRVGTELSLIPENTDLIFVATPHDAVVEVAEGLASVTHLPFRRLAVCHASGMLTAAALAPLKDRGSVVFSFHPLQTFPRDFPPRKILPYARGIAYGVDGPPEGIRMARRLAHALEGKIVLIPPDLRVLYHAACVAASNHLTTVLWIVQTMYEFLRVRGVKFYPMFGPIVEATLANIARTSPAAALSGPIARGGTETLAAHFKALEKNLPELIPYFAAVSLETVRLAAAKGSVDSVKEEELLRLIHMFQSSEITKQENL
jgi:predicted short-subunit dehydrogenase-like oxidoreductase (DUF2520 family)